MEGGACPQPHGHWPGQRDNSRNRVAAAGVPPSASCRPGAFQNPGPSKHLPTKHHSLHGGPCGEHVGGVAGHMAPSLCKQLRVSSWIGGPCAHRECPSTGTAEEAATGRRPGGDGGRPAQCGHEPRTPGATEDKRQGGPARTSKGPHAGLARASCLHTVCGALSRPPRTLTPRAAHGTRRSLRLPCRTTPQTSATLDTHADTTECT